MLTPNQIKRYDSSEEYAAIISELRDLKDKLVHAIEISRECMNESPQTSYCRGRKDAYEQFYELISDKLYYFGELLAELKYPSEE